MLQIDGRKLLIAIANKGCSSSELAKKSEISQITLTKLKTGKHYARTQTIFRLSKALECKIEDLISEEN